MKSLRWLIEAVNTHAVALAAMAGSAAGPVDGAASAHAARAVR